MSLHVQNHQLHHKPPRHIIPTGKVFESVTNDVSRVITPITLDLFRSQQSPPCLELKHPFLQSKSSQKRSLENKEEEIMRSSSQKLDLRLNLSPPPRGGDSPPTPSRSPSVSPLSSCVSSEEEGGSSGGGSMVLVGCPRCLMYVMLSEHDPKCPKCKSDVLLDFVGNNNNNKNKYYSSVGSSKKTKKN